MNQREQAIATIREALDNIELRVRERDLEDSNWWMEDMRKYRASAMSALDSISALSEPGGEAEPVAWIYEDQLPGGYPYDIMFHYSEVRDGVRMFPVYAPLSADRIMEAVQSGATHQVVNGDDWILVSRSDLRSRLSELGLK